MSCVRPIAIGSRGCTSALWPNAPPDQARGRRLLQGAKQRWGRVGLVEVGERSGGPSRTCDSWCSSAVGVRPAPPSHQRRTAAHGTWRTRPARWRIQRKISIRWRDGIRVGLLILLLLLILFFNHHQLLLLPFLLIVIIFLRISQRREHRDAVNAIWKCLHAYES